MCSYNSINGQPGCANEFLLQDQLRRKWGFNGYVVSDCGAVTDIFQGHHFRATQAEASAISLRRGMDNECADFFTKVTDDHDYKPYLDAVHQGYLRESEIDVTLTRLFTARMKLGMFDPPEMVPYTNIDEKLLDSAEHRAMARKLANEAMVLLKNDGVLPLKTGALKIALVGPLADQTRVLLGNYNGIPTHSVSVLDGLKAEFPSAKITFVPGTQFLRNDGTPVPNALLTTPDGKPGVKADYATGDLMGGKPTPLLSEVEPGINLSSDSIPAGAKGKTPIGVQWTGFLTPTESGDFKLGVLLSGFVGITVDGKNVTGTWAPGAPEPKMGTVHLEKGKKVSFSIQYGMLGEGVRCQLIWQKVNMAPSPEAVAAAKDADVVVAVVGITSELEGEEMQVSEDGFAGGDRTKLDLPKPEEELLESVAATGKPLVETPGGGADERQRSQRQLGKGTCQRHRRCLVFR
jgi:beta-glucosidase